jgi:LDH2 family malate/lactate/ureidoglycolate dehydrogenase
MHLIKADRLHQFVTAVFVSVGFPEHKAKLSADVLIEADLRGIQ